MKKVVVLVVFLAAISVPSAFATAELQLTSGATTVNILDAGAGDVNGTSGAVTYIGSVGSWTLNITSGIEGSLPFFDLVSFNATSGQVDPLTMYFSDNGMTLPLAFDFNVGGTVSATGVTPTVSFTAWTGGPGKFDLSNQIGSTLTFHTAAYSGGTSGAVAPGDTSLTIGAVIDLAKGTTGAASFDAALDSKVPEPASITMLGGVLLILGGAIRRRIKRA